MELRVTTGSVTEIETPALIVSCYQGPAAFGDATGAVDQALGGQIATLISEGEITGRLEEITLLHTAGRLPARRVLVVGLGPRATCDLEALRRAMGVATRRLLQHKITSFHTILHGGGDLAATGLDTRSLAQALAEAAVLAGYRCDAYQTVSGDEEAEGAEPRPRARLAGFTVIEPDARKRAAIQRGLARGEKLARAVNYTRDLGNTPPNEMTPARLAERARALAEEHGLTCTVMTGRELKVKKMGAILGVGQGSANDPRLIILRYNGGRGGRAPVALVGKAITFDTGGISIKPSQNMEEMKFDKMGGCAVLGILMAAALLELKVNLLGVIPAAENMPSGTAYRPGDILTSYSGKTIEIINTDAEGRLVLADALTWASEQKPRQIIDLATLTGACVVALGHAASGAFGDPAMVARLQAVGETTGDRAWPLPLYDDFSNDMKSEIADIKNSGGRWGGASTAAAFLKFFVGEGIPWAHLDIAGTAWVTKPKAYTPYGATGAGVRLVTEFLATR